MSWSIATVPGVGLLEKICGRAGVDDIPMASGSVAHRDRKDQRRRALRLSRGHPRGYRRRPSARPDRRSSALELQAVKLRPRAAQPPLARIPAPHPPKIGGASHPEPLHRPRHTRHQDNRAIRSRERGRPNISRSVRQSRSAAPAASKTFALGCVYNFQKRAGLWRADIGKATAVVAAVKFRISAATCPGVELSGKIGGPPTKVVESRFACFPGRPRPAADKLDVRRLVREDQAIAPRPQPGFDRLSESDPR